MKNHYTMFQPLKGILMLLIIFSHSIDIPEFSLPVNPLSGLFRFLYDFASFTCIPCFFMVCGYGFRKKPLRILMQNTVLPILRAYLITSVIILVIHALRSFVVGRDVLPSLLPRILCYVLMVIPATRYFGCTVESIGAIWFLCTLAFTSLMLNLILQIKDQWKQGVVCLVLCWLGLYLRDFSPPFCISQSCICCSFLYLGYQIRQLKLLEKKLPWYYTAGALLLCLLLCLKKSHRIGVSYSWFPGGLATIVAVCFLSYLLLYYASYLDQPKGRFFDGLCWLGQYSFLLCCVHQVERNALPLQTLLARVLKDSMWQDAVYFLSRTILCISITYLLVAIGKQRRLRA